MPRFWLSFASVAFQARAQDASSKRMRASRHRHPSPSTSASGSESSGSGGIAVATPPKKEHGINWAGVFEGSLAFLTVEHAFRIATEQGTRDASPAPHSSRDISIPSKVFTDGPTATRSWSITLGIPCKALCPGSSGSIMTAPIAPWSSARTAGTGRASCAARPLPTCTACNSKSVRSARPLWDTFRPSTRSRASLTTSLLRPSAWDGPSPKTRLTAMSYEPSKLIPQTPTFACWPAAR